MMLFGRSSGSSELGRLGLVRPLQRLIVIVGLAQLARPLQRLRQMVGQHLALLPELAQPQQLILRLVRPPQRLSEITTPRPPQRLRRMEGSTLF